MDAILRVMNPWWEGRSFETGVRREIYLGRLAGARARRQVEILIGSRRIGKTTLLRQVIGEILAAGVPAHDVCYLALDHPALEAAPVSEHLKRFRKEFLHQRERRLFLFLDEIQDSPDWENELKALYDTEQIKFYCSGSTSALLERAGGKLTGRQITTTVYPLSFAEFLAFRGSLPTLAEDYRMERLAEEYLAVGGYPEQVLSPSHEYLASLVNDILARDLLRLHPIRKPAALKDLLRLVAASTGSRVSFNRLAKLLGLSLDTAKEYAGYLESAFLVAPMDKWTSSHSERVYSKKKLYLQDTGVRTVFSGAGDEGSRAENAVFMELKRRGVAAGYWAESDREVDFVIGAPTDPLPLEVKMLDAVDLADRRLAGMRLFLRRHPETKRALVVSRSTATTLPAGDIGVEAVPLWLFLLNAERYP
ncbi:MAG: ATP-binding protein [Acidobacteriota bacterium]